MAGPFTFGICSDMSFKTLKEKRFFKSNTRHVKRSSNYYLIFTKSQIPLSSANAALNH